MNNFSIFPLQDEISRKNTVPIHPCSESVTDIYTDINIYVYAMWLHRTISCLVLRCSTITVLKLTLGFEVMNIFAFPLATLLSLTVTSHNVCANWSNPTKSLGARLAVNTSCWMQLEPTQVPKCALPVRCTTTRS